MSLSYYFLYAGAKSVVSSLWKLDDKSTYIVMAKFYKYLAEGKTKSEALRQAQLDYIHYRNKDKTAFENKDFYHPYFWAGIQLQGNDKPLVFKTPN